MPQTILAIYEPTTIAHNFYRHAPNVLPIPSRHDAKICMLGSLILCCCTLKQLYAGMPGPVVTT